MIDTAKERRDPQKNFIYNPRVCIRRNALKSRSTLKDPNTRFCEQLNTISEDARVFRRCSEVRRSCRNRTAHRVIDDTASKGQYLTESEDTEFKLCCHKMRGRGDGDTSLTRDKCLIIHVQYIYSLQTTVVYKFLSGK